MKNYVWPIVQEKRYSTIIPSKVYLGCIYYSNTVVFMASYAKKTVSNFARSLEKYEFHKDICNILRTIPDAFEEGVQQHYTQARKDIYHYDVNTES